MIITAGFKARLL